MRRRFPIRNTVLVLFSFLISVSAFVAQTRTRPPGQRPPASDFKVTYKVTTESAGGQGQASETTTMIKGARERTESHSNSGYDTVNILQCDLKRTIQISDSAKKYVITPLETGDTSTPRPTETPTPTSPTRAGGIVTYTTSIIDTGERKEMFGFTARHVKSTTMIESSPDACNPVSLHTELDGWYIDLTAGLDCRTSRPATAANRPSRPGCQDQTRFRQQGNGKLGYPLIETMKMFGPGDQVMFSTTKEVVELSRQPLDAALFDLPAGYSEASSTQELYTPPTTDPMGRAQAQDTTGGNVSQSMPSMAATKKPGSILIGVVQINNKAGRPVSLDALRGRLVGQLEGAGVDAVALNAASQMEAEAEAKSKQCDFILYTDIAALKVSKLGGMFGRVAGVEGAGNTEAKLEFKLFAVGESSPRLQSSSSAKEQGDEASAGSAIDAEARTVSAEVRRRGRG